MMNKYLFLCVSFLSHPRKQFSFGNHILLPATLTDGGKGVDGK